MPPKKETKVNQGKIDAAIAALMVLTDLEIILVLAGVGFKIYKALSARFPTAVYRGTVLPLKQMLQGALAYKVPVVQTITSAGVNPYNPTSTTPTFQTQGPRTERKKEGKKKPAKAPKPEQTKTDKVWSAVSSSEKFAALSDQDRKEAENDWTLVKTEAKKVLAEWKLGNLSGLNISPQQVTLLNAENFVCYKSPACRAAWGRLRSKLQGIHAIFKAERSGFFGEKKDGKTKSPLAGDNASVKAPAPPVFTLGTPMVAPTAPSAAKAAGADKIEAKKSPPAPAAKNPDKSGSKKQNKSGGKSKPPSGSQTPDGDQDPQQA